MTHEERASCPITTKRGNAKIDGAQNCVEDDCPMRDAVNGCAYVTAAIKVMRIAKKKRAATRAAKQARKAAATK